MNDHEEIEHAPERDLPIVGVVMLLLGVPIWIGVVHWLLVWWLS